jgi:16S rRNA (guanine527-N7)-methyltransferase
VEHTDRGGPARLEELRLRGLIALGLAELAYPPDLAPQLTRLAIHVSRWAERLNLTAHRSPEAVARRLILDALALGRALPEMSPTSIADLGSGAGFPGIPLAILWPGCHVTLVDSRERRNHFQRSAVRELGLANVQTLRGRAESVPHEPHQIAIAQAMAQPATVLGWLRDWVNPGGWIVLPLSESQLAELPRFEVPLGVIQAETRSYEVPLGGARRSLWIGRRAASSA